MRRLLALMTLAVVGALALHVPGVSWAAYSVRTTNVASVKAADDWTPPTVSVDPVAGPLTGTATVSATAADERSGVASVTLQTQAPGSTSWTTLCVDTTAPYSCSWTTTGGADGTWGLRATAVDAAGYAATSAKVTVTVANKLAITLGDPGEAVRGGVPLTATLSGTGSSSYQVVIQYADAGTSTWKTLCGPSAATSTSYSCTWTTTSSAFVQGNDYDLRALAVSGGVTAATSPLVAAVQVDNVAPSATMTDPGSPLRGTVTLAATASDRDSGVVQVVLQYQPAGGAWTTACTVTVDPYSCRFSTTGLANGTYAFRAIATDDAGNATTSAAVTNRTVDNTVSSVSLEDPGAFVSGAVTLTATAASTAGVASVRIDRAPTGTTTWTTICTVTASPYSCAWDTSALATGGYDLRAVLTDGGGRTTTSSTVSTQVDNTPLRGYDVQAANGGGTAGRVDAGDVLTYTYTTQVLPSSLLAGWSGGSTPVTVRLKDNSSLLGLNSTSDSIDVFGPGGTSTAVNLGSINLKANYIGYRGTALFAATMTASTTLLNGLPATTITVTLGAMTSGSGLKTASSGTMVWTPSAAAKDLAGRAASTATVTERGTTDQDL